MSEKEIANIGTGHELRPGRRIRNEKGKGSRNYFVGIFRVTAPYLSPQGRPQCLGPQLNKPKQMKALSWVSLKHIIILYIDNQGKNITLAAASGCLKCYILHSTKNCCMDRTISA